MCLLILLPRQIICPWFHFPDLSCLTTTSSHLLCLFPSVSVHLFFFLALLPILSHLTYLFPQILACKAHLYPCWWGQSRKAEGKMREGHHSALAFLCINPTMTAAVRGEPGTKWSIYWLNEKIAFFQLLEDPSFNVCDAEAPASNGFSIFVVQRHEKMKFAAQLTEIIYSHKSVVFIRSLRTVNMCFVMVGCRRQSSEYRRSDHHIKTLLP